MLVRNFAGSKQSEQIHPKPGRIEEETKWFSPNKIEAKQTSLLKTLWDLSKVNNVWPSQALLRPSQALLQPLKALSVSTSLSLSGLALAQPLLKLSPQNSKLCEILAKLTKFAHSFLQPSQVGCPRNYTDTEFCPFFFTSVYSVFRAELASIPANSVTFFMYWIPYISKKTLLTNLDTQSLLPTVFFVIFLVQNVHTNVTW